MLKEMSGGRCEPPALKHAACARYGRLLGYNSKKYFVCMGQYPPFVVQSFKFSRERIPHPIILGCLSSLHFFLIAGSAHINHREPCHFWLLVLPFLYIYS
jgi:hypothetical protein